MSIELPELCFTDGCRRLKGHPGRHNPYPSEAWNILNEKDDNKLTKAGFATPRGGAKGAYQNHVDRSNRVILPLEFLSQVSIEDFQDGYVIRLFPHQYFESKNKVRPEFNDTLKWIIPGENAFVLYRTHESFETLGPPPDWKIRSLEKNGVPVTRRGAGVIDRGHYVLRLPTLGRDKQQRDEGPPQGLFATEYANSETNFLCKCVLAWLTIHTLSSPYTAAAAKHLHAILRYEELDNLKDLERLGLLTNGLTQCPLCLRVILYKELHQTVAFDDESGLQNAAAQVEGATRSTIVNLFHIKPLYYHSLVHIPGNVGWGHAVCNTRLGQRPCYSLPEIIEMNQKIAFVRGDGIETFGWMSTDEVMIRSVAGAVWIKIADEGVSGPPESTEEIVDPII